MHIRTTLTSAGDPVTFSRIFRTLEPLMGDESYGLGGLRQFLPSASSLFSFPCQYMCPTECIYDTKYVYCNSNPCLLPHIVIFVLMHISKNAPMDSLREILNPSHLWLAKALTRRKSAQLEEANLELKKAQYRTESSRS